MPFTQDPKPVGGFEKAPVAGNAVEVFLSADKSGTRLRIDGVEIAHLVDITIKHHAGDVNRVLIEFFPTSVQITGMGNYEKREKLFPCSIPDAIANTAPTEDK